MISPSDLYCLNAATGKRDGSHCVWEGGGKCLKCQAADRIAALEAENSALRERITSAKRAADQLSNNWEGGGFAIGLWDAEKLFDSLDKALEGREGE